jgi:hypothetical protein
MGRLPKYSIAILVAQTVAVIASVVLLALDEQRLWAYLWLPLMTSFAIQHYRLRRACKQNDSEFAAHLR